MTSSPTASSSCRSPANGNRDMISDKSWGLQCRSGCILCRSKYSVQFIQHQKTCLFPWQKKQTLWRRPIKAKYSWIFLNEKSSQFSESHICHRSLWQSMAVSGCDCLQLEKPASIPESKKPLEAVSNKHQDMLTMHLPHAKQVDDRCWPSLQLARFGCIGVSMVPVDSSCHRFFGVWDAVCNGPKPLGSIKVALVHGSVDLLKSKPHLKCASVGWCWPKWKLRSWVCHGSRTSGF